MQKKKYNASYKAQISSQNAVDIKYKYPFFIKENFEAL